MGLSPFFNHFLVDEKCLNYKKSTYIIKHSYFKCLAFFIQDREGNISLNKETNIELSAIPLTTQRNSSEHLLPEEDFYDGHEENDSFTTQQLFSFAWQIAKGMVRPRFFCTDRPSSVNKMFTKQKLQFAQRSWFVVATINFAN